MPFKIGGPKILQTRVGAKNRLKHVTFYVTMSGIIFASLQRVMSVERIFLKKIGIKKRKIFFKSFNFFIKKYYIINMRK